MPEPNAPVDPNELLLRRSFCDPMKKYLNPDGTAHSRVFKPRPKDAGKLSVDVKSMTTLEKAIFDPLKFILFELEVSEVLNLGLECVHDPLQDGSNPAHALIKTIPEEDEIFAFQLSKVSRQVKVA
jgi:hypothetical protein